MNRFAAVLFNLDGTLIDPGDGIANTIQFALDTLGIDCRFDGSARWYFGPPIGEIFSKVLSAPRGSDLIERAVSLYLERFATHGALESVVYPRIKEILTELRISARLFLVTSKNTAVAEQMLTAHLLRHYFNDVIGTERDSRLADKTDAVGFILKEFDLNPKVTAMVGDRMHDIIADKAYGIFTIGVTYGYRADLRRR